MQNFVRPAVSALAATYFIWGTTFLVTRLTVESWPPFLLVAARCAVGAMSLAILTRVRPKFGNFRQASYLALTGLLLFAGGHGLLAQALRTTASGVSAVALATIPLWLTLFEASAKRRWPSPVELGALCLGLVGVVILVQSLGGHGLTSGAGGSLLISSALAWAIGSHLTRQQLGRLDPLPCAAGQLCFGAMTALAVSLILGERWSVSMASPASLMMLAYLGVFASAGAFIGYSWLLANTTPARAGSYALVNPVVAVAVGWMFGGEEMRIQLALACLLVLVAVALLFFPKPRSKHDPQKLS